VFDRVEAEHATLVACHFPEPGFGHLVRVEGRRYWQGRRSVQRNQRQCQCLRRTLLDARTSAKRPVGITAVEHFGARGDCRGHVGRRIFDADGTDSRCVGTAKLGNGGR
jgi:hypothetical protein